jgi:uncharacterized protein (TIGR02996 family)
MTSDGDALFRAICAQPWEDTPRLVYADWLQENGQLERAEFIRIQCQFRDQEKAGHEQFAALIPQWQAELPQLRGVEWHDTHFERGFVCWVTFSSPNKFREHAEAVFAAAPVDFVRVYSVHERTARHVLRSPLLARIKNLVLVGNLIAKVMRELGDCAALTRLEDLWLRDSVTDEGALALAESPYLGRLKNLTIMWHEFTPAGVRALVRSERLAALGHLYLTPNTFDLDLTTELRTRFPRSAYQYPLPSEIASTELS